MDGCGRGWNFLVDVNSSPINKATALVCACFSLGEVLGDLLTHHKKFSFPFVHMCARACTHTHPRPCPPRR